MLFLIGVVMTTVGVALVLIPDIKLPEGRVLRPLPRIIIGCFFLSIFPVMFLAQPFIGDFELIFYRLFQWGIVFFLLMLSLFVFLLTTQPTRKGSKIAKTPSGNRGRSHWPETTSSSSSQQNSSQEDSDNPFRFT